MQGPWILAKLKLQEIPPDIQVCGIFFIIGGRSIHPGFPAFKMAGRQIQLSERLPALLYPLFYKVEKLVTLTFSRRADQGGFVDDVGQIVLRLTAK